MAINVILAAGDGDVVDQFDLTTYVVAQGLSAPPPEPGARTRAIELTLDINASDADALWTAWGNVEQKLTQARRAAGPYGLGTGVTLSVQLDTTEWVYFDVLDGVLSLSNLGILSFHNYAVLSLVCLPYGRGDRYTATLDPATTLTNGDGMSVLIEEIPGDCPALCRVRVNDVSTGSAVINGIRIGARSLHGLESGDFDGILDLTASGGGVSVSESNTVGGSLVRLSPPLMDWSTVARVTMPAAQYTTGLYDLMLRCRDAASIMGMPTQRSATGGAAGTTAGPTRWRQWQTTTGTDNSAELTINWPAWPGRIITLSLGIRGNVTPTTPAGWTLRASQVNGTTCGAYHYDKYSDGTETTVTINLSGAADEWRLVYAEWFGLDYTTAPDQTVTATGTSTGPTVLSGTLGQNTELVIGLIAFGGALTSVTKGAAYTALVQTDPLLVQYRTTTVTTSTANNATLSSSQAWAAVSVSYRVELYGVVNTTVPNLAASTYHFMVSALNASGGESVALDLGSVAAAANAAYHLTWTAPTTGTVAQYRLYWNRGAGWKYRDTGDDVTTASLWTETSASTGDPLTVIAGEPASFRLLVGIEGETQPFETPAAVAHLSNTVWELLPMGLATLPPQAADDGGTPRDWFIDVQVKSTSETPSDVDVDALWLFPHDEPQTYVWVEGKALATNRDHLIDTRRDGILVATLLEDGTTTPAGQLMSRNAPLMLGPGSAQLVGHLEAAAGVSDVTDLKADLTVELTPLYRLLRGA